MSVHSNDYTDYEEYKQDLAFEYREERCSLYYYTGQTNEPDCESCTHNKYLYTKEDGTKVWECDTHECEYEEEI